MNRIIDKCPPQRRRLNHVSSLSIVTNRTHPALSTAMSSFVLSSGRPVLPDTSEYLTGSALRTRTGVPAVRGRAGPVTPSAFFGGLGGPKSNGKAMVCIDCGYVYRGGDFDGLPKDWSCPPCGVGKNRFKVYQEGNAYDQMAAQKKANKQALAAKKKGGPSNRELLKQKMLEEQAEMDKKKGGGFFGR